MRGFYSLNTGLLNTGCRRRTASDNRGTCDDLGVGEGIK